MKLYASVLLLTSAAMLAGCSDALPGGNGASDTGVGGPDGADAAARAPRDAGAVSADAGPARDAGGEVPDSGGWNSGCGPVEICGNGLDDNCDGRVDENCACLPGLTQACYGGFPAHAGVGVCTWGTQSCPEGQDVATWGPCTGYGEPEPVVCGAGRDSLCSGQIDEGCDCNPGDERTCYTGPVGTATVGACRPGSETCIGAGAQASWGPCLGEVVPAAQSSCDGEDRLCNGRPWEGCGCTPGDERACYDGPPGTESTGLCRPGAQRCEELNGLPGWGPCTGQVVPASSNPCDGQDHLCTGDPWDGCTCVPSQTRSCYSGPAGTAGVGLCRAGTETCVLAAGVPEWGPCVGEVTPSPNTCDGLDRLCTGNPESGGCLCTIGTTRPCYSGPAGTAGVGLCRGGAETCEPGAGGAGAAWSACAGEVLPAPNLCDGIDRLCDGAPLSGCACTLNDTRPCYEGASATRGVGACRDGTQACVAAGNGTEWAAACSGQILPSVEICGNGIDDDCDGFIDEGCAPTITCPAPATVRAGAQVSLAASATSPSGPITGYAWTILSAPTGGVGTPGQWAPAPPTAATVAFRPAVIGGYVLQVTATDSAGQTASCTTQVTAEGHGLRVELTWDGPGNLDLHLHDPFNTPWFTAGDCWAGNRTPIWDPASPAGQGANPVLDWDNASGFGPEHITVEEPITWNGYTIAVAHHGGAAGRVATVRIFCGGGTTPVASFTSLPMTGNEVGNCTNNSFWKVGHVRFSSATACTVDPFDNYRSTQGACLQW